MSDTKPSYFSFTKHGSSCSCRCRCFILFLPCPSFKGFRTTYMGLCCPTHFVLTTSLWSLECHQSKVTQWTSWPNRDLRNLGIPHSSLCSNHHIGLKRTDKPFLVSYIFEIKLCSVTTLQLLSPFFLSISEYLCFNYSAAVTDQNQQLHNLPSSLSAWDNLKTMPKKQWERMAGCNHVNHQKKLAVLQAINQQNSHQFRWMHHESTNIKLTPCLQKR